MKKLFLALGLAICLAACGSAPEPAPEQPATTSALGDDCVIPTWYQTVPADSAYFLARGNAAEEYLEDAERMAFAAAKRYMSDNLKLAFQRKAKERRARVVESIGTDVNWTDVIEEISAVEFIDISPSPNHQYVCTDRDGQFHVFMLGRLPRDQMFESLKRDIRRTQLLKQLYEEEGDLEELKTALYDTFDPNLKP